MKIAYSKSERVTTGVFDATSMEEAKLLRTMTEADLGETVSAADLLKRIRRS